MNNGKQLNQQTQREEKQPLVIQKRGSRQSRSLTGGKLFEVDGKPKPMILILKCSRCEELRYVHFLSFDKGCPSPESAFAMLVGKEFSHTAEIKSKHGSLVTGYYNCGVFQPVSIFKQVAEV